MAVKLKQPKKKESLKKTKNSPKSITNSPIENIEIVPRQAVDEIISSDTREKYMSLGDHLEELRQRLIHCIFIVAIFTIGFLIFGSEVHEIFASPYKKVLGANATFYQIKLMAPMLIYLKTSFLLAKILLTRNPELATNLFDKSIYPTAYSFGWHEPQDSTELGLYFNKFDKVGDKELIRLLNSKNLDEKEIFYLEFYLILLSRYDWQCDVNKKFKSIYYSIKNREGCRIEVTKGKSDNFYYMLKIFYKKDVYDISFTKDHKIKGIQCNNFSTEGY